MKKLIYLSIFLILLNCNQVKAETCPSDPEKEGWKWVPMIWITERECDRLCKESGAKKSCMVPGGGFSFLCYCKN